MYDRKIMLIAGLVLGAMLFIISHYPSAADIPDILELDELGDIYEPVIFDHAMHVDMTSCADCHHHTTGLPDENKRCLPCHRESDTADDITCTGCHPHYPGTAEKMRTLREMGLFHIDKTGLKRAYHLKCLGCHKEMDVPSDCEDCHPKKDDADKTEDAQ